eukprot:GHUV01033173.1.p1 GENE.GHUV01033173.1~~GHUV01033173.1.p1  ORF type:complete len:214 (+),score=45.13 GHUV01033173.1:940-1581(+)
MEKTKLAQAIAELFVGLARVIGGQTAALSCIYLVTALLSELLTNNASAAIMWPIAAAAAEQLGIDINIMSVAVMLGGSAGWILPYSYQCNLMVYAAGKYKTSDFVKIGTPYHVWLLAGVILILNSGRNWSTPIIASMVFTGIVIIVPALYEYVLSDEQKLKVDKKLASLGAAISKLLGRKTNKGFGTLSSNSFHSVGADEFTSKDVAAGGDRA